MPGHLLFLSTFATEMDLFEPKEWYTTQMEEAETFIITTLSVFCQAAR